MTKTIQETLSEMREGESRFAKTDKGYANLVKGRQRKPSLISDVLKARRQAKAILPPEAGKLSFKQ